MKAAVFEAFAQPVTIQDVPDPVPADDGVVLRVEATGICRSDWHGWMGHDPDIRLPHVPGHELAGVVEVVGRDVRGWRPGDRVTVPFSVGCGRCAQCQAGNQQVCDNYFQPGFTAWGSFAQYVAIRYADTNLVRLPEAIGFAEAASLGCRFGTAFRAVVAQGRVRAGEWVVVHGCGGVGLSAIMVAHAVGANVVGVDISDEKIAAAQALGAVQGLNARRVVNVVAAIREITGGGAHVSIDALGSPATCRNSIKGLRKRGRHVQVGLLLADERDTPVPMDQVIAKELEIYGSHGIPAHAYGPMLDMIAAGKLSPARLIGKTITLAEAPAELAAMGHFSGTGVTIITRFD